MPHTSSIGADPAVLPVFVIDGETMFMAPKPNELLVAEHFGQLLGRFCKRPLERAEVLMVRKQKHGF